GKRSPVRKEYAKYEVPMTRCDFETLAASVEQAWSAPTEDPASQSKEERSRSTMKEISESSSFSEMGQPPATFKVACSS
ncbi:hypothetical protein KI387_000737, partial [Taxus chinensis]